MNLAMTMGNKFSITRRYKGLATRRRFFAQIQAGSRLKSLSQDSRPAPELER